MSREGVILLHGLGRTRYAMAGMARGLRSAGFEAENLGYPSRSHGLERLCEELLPKVQQVAAAYDRTHFVAHSMGNILIRMMAERDPSLVTGRVVMLAPPNQGSEIVDALGDWLPFRLLMGPAAKELGTDSASMPRRLPAPDFEFAVIAGRRSSSPWFSPLFDEENDGKVSVPSTRLEGMKEHLVLPVTHTFLMNSPKVIRHCVRFLRKGQF